MVDEVEKIAQHADTERRRCRRKLVSGTALIPVDVAPDGGFALLVDLSMEGTAVQAVAQLDHDGKKTLRWRFPGDENFTQVEGTIVWSNPSKMFGIRFSHVSDDARARIEKWVAEPGVEFDLSLGDIQTEFQGEDVSTPTVRSGDADAETPPDVDVPQNEKLWLDLQLGLLAGEVRSVMSADGVAIAVASGNTFVCKASVGSAPDLGAVLVGDAGLSAECIRTGRVVCCLDSRTDPRVDAKVCERLHLGSAVVAPIKRAATVEALLEVFWSGPNAFSDVQLPELCAFVGKVLSLLDPDAALPAATETSFDEPAPLPARPFVVSHLKSPRLREAVPSALSEDAGEPRPPLRVVSAAHPPIPERSTFDAEMQAGSDLLGRVLLAATIVLGLLAILTGVLAWYGPARLTSTVTQAEDANAGSIPTPEDSESIPLPEVASARSTVAQRGVAQDRPSPAITDVRLAPSESTRRTVTPSKSRVPVGSGTVLLDVKIDPKGKITDVRVVRGDPKLAKLAKEALASQRYPIATLTDGSPPSNARVVVSFGPPK